MKINSLSQQKDQPDNVASVAVFSGTEITPRQKNNEALMSNARY